MSSDSNDRKSYSSDRRSLLKIFGAIGATCAYPFQSDELYGQTVQPAHQHAMAAPAESADPKFFNVADFALVSRIADLIIPDTETPGAIKAGVPSYIDAVVARNAGQQALAADGLRWIDAEAERVAGRKFLQLDEEKQLSILEELCEAAEETPNQAPGTSAGRNVQFFAMMKGLTADGYYTSRIGLIQELGYKGNTVMSSFAGCVPEH
ncbi:MAG: gluconate 2-dehydrogenase subunit 3 family protein [Bryobacteraceae bacterium]